MYIISIDVGIKNLAFCLFYYDSTNTNYTVEKWDIVNVANNKIKKQIKKCCSNSCKRNATLYKDEIYYCTQHAKKSKYIIPSKTNSLSKWKKERLDKIKDFCDTNNIDTTDCHKKNDYIKLVSKFLSENTLSKIDKETTNIPLTTIGKNMLLKFDSLFSSYNIEVVLIENQISPIANRMKTIQGMITQYFIMRDVDTIEFISSSNKLKDFCNKKTNYKERKKLGIDITKEKIEENETLHKWKEHFHTHKKKDDLADSYLQGLWFIKYRINNSIN